MDKNVDLQYTTIRTISKRTGTIARLDDSLPLNTNRFHSALHCLLCFTLRCEIGPRWSDIRQHLHASKPKDGQSDNQYPSRHMTLITLITLYIYRPEIDVLTRSLTLKNPCVLFHYLYNYVFFTRCFSEFQDFGHIPGLDELFSEATTRGDAIEKSRGRPSPFTESRSREWMSSFMRYSQRAPGVRGKTRKGITRKWNSKVLLAWIALQSLGLV